ncbi:hypothetical protein CROQUDRAFT_135309 [Cronartium quercuum f. sp. fusiforme G11]|uniref:Uncharacterized protein n=1 Tax=Cronartium quercuum f. sp. fusiforme G11 TaxID=708437 RepID=A0A9P6T8C3_9BASI|nr:hypothetical protein CROQUDRAFT_135309 [Cronartium quercuum f. sp. fusiforme G11]
MTLQKDRYQKHVSPSPFHTSDNKRPFSPPHPPLQKDQHYKQASSSQPCLDPKNEIYEKNHSCCNCDQKLEQMIHTFAHNPDVKVDRIIDITNTIEAKIKPLRTFIHQQNNNILTEIKKINILPKTKDYEERELDESHLGTQRLIAASSEELLDKQLYFEDLMEKRLDAIEEAITKNMSIKDIIENKLESIGSLLQQMNDQGIQDRQTMLNDIQQVKMQRNSPSPHNIKPHTMPMAHTEQSKTKDEINSMKEAYPRYIRGSNKHAPTNRNGGHCVTNGPRTTFGKISHNRRKPKG